MTPSRIDALAEAIKHAERRVRNIYMSEADHRIAEQELVRLRADFWLATMELGKTNSELAAIDPTIQEPVNVAA